MPNGFSMITRARSPSPASPSASIVPAERAAAAARGSSRTRGVAAELLARRGDRLARARSKPVADAGEAQRLGERAPRSSASSGLRPSPRPPRAPARGTPRRSIALAGGADDPEALRHQPDPGEVEHPRQQLALGQVAGRAEEDDHLVLGDLGAVGALAAGACGGDAHALRLTDARARPGAARDYAARADGRRARPHGGVEFDPRALDRVERRFWRDIWESVPAAVAGRARDRAARLRAGSGDRGRRRCRRSGC